jgi:hypothetical protein
MKIFGQGLKAVLILSVEVSGKDRYLHLGKINIMYKIIFTFLIFANVFKAAAQKVVMEAASWDVEKQKASFTKRDGKDAITLDRGIVWAKGIDFADGIIEADVSVYPQRNFGGVCFRGDEAGNYELICLRVPMSGRDDALQYVPSFNREVNWQLATEKILKLGYMVKDKDVYPIDNVVRLKETGQFAIIKRQSFLGDGKSFLNYLAQIEGRREGLYAIYHEEVELETLPRLS